MVCKVFLTRPQKGKQRHVIKLLLRELGWEIIEKYEDGCLVWSWNQGSRVGRNPSEKIIQMLPKQKFVINGDCFDVSKRKVEDVFEKVFGYSLRIDPRRYDYKYVMKNNDNGCHDGKIMIRKISEQEYAEFSKKYVFEKLINNINPKNLKHTIDYRVPYYGYPSMVYISHIKKKHRFKQINVKTVVRKPLEVFSEEEVRKINSFCQLMGLDCGDLDIVRDFTEGRIYILDVNDCARITHRGYSRKEFRQSIRTQANSLQDFILEKLGRNLEHSFIMNNEDL